MSRSRLAQLGIVFAVLWSGATGNAICNQSAASQADRDLWNTHGCWEAFFLWQYQAYDMREGDWSGRGWDDACNVLKEYPKHWNAAYLLTYGMQDNWRYSFHGTSDYRGTAERWDNNYHDDLNHTPTDATDMFGAWIYHLIGPNEVQTSCLLYVPRLSANANPASRA